jgi:hypothetical protein
MRRIDAQQDITMAHHECDAGRSQHHRQGHASCHQCHIRVGDGVWSEARATCTMAAMATAPKINAVHHPFATVSSKKKPAVPSRRYERRPAICGQHQHMVRDSAATTLVIMRLTSAADGAG